MSFETAAYTPDNLSALLSEAQDNQLMSRLGVPSYEITPTASARPSPADLGAASSSLTWVWYTFGAIGLGYYLFFLHAYNWKAAQRR